ncbi:hypothetical protein [uncultured Algoriphagus sp.]|uniref:hypothetical protein n=1 Tax=uncultured Algoriphagus sp. TaxID=417365 RepID=UPI0030ED55DA
MYKFLYCFLFTALFLLAAQLQVQTVSISKTGARLNKESCRYSITGWASDLAAAKKIGLTACLVCESSSTETREAKPIPLTSEPKKLESSKETIPTQPASTQCRATTTKFVSRCSRKSAAGSSYCWHHDG